MLDIGPFKGGTIGAIDFLGGIGVLGDLYSICGPLLPGRNGSNNLKPPAISESSVSHTPISSLSGTATAVSTVLPTDLISVDAPNLRNFIHNQKLVSVDKVDVISSSKVSHADSLFLSIHSLHHFFLILNLIYLFS
jgi:hypothetical protein